MKCDWCDEKYEKMPVTKCGLKLCPLCWDDHRREGCDDCAAEEFHEAADYYHDKEKDV